MEHHEVFGRVGTDGFGRLVRAFYRRVPHDEILGPMYPQQDFEGAEKRLRDFLIYRFGGPDTYIQERGHPRLRMRHAPFRVDQAARDRWVELMDQAFEEAQLDEEAVGVVRPFLHDVATMMMNA